MARPPSIRDEDLLDAAIEVFRRRGLEATTAEVAAKAGVSEGTLFNRFKNKHELFAAALRKHTHVDAPWIASLPERVGQGDVFAHLTEIAEQGLAFFAELMPVMVMMASATTNERGIPEHLADANAPPLRALRLLASYLEAEMRLGRLARHDAEVVARTIVGAIYNFAFSDHLMRHSHVLPMPAGTFVRGLVELLRAGLDPATRVEPARATTERAKPTALRRRKPASTAR